MHLLVITDDFYPEAIGGVGRSLTNECVALAARGIQIEVIVRSTNPQLAPEERVNGMLIRRFFGPTRQNPLYYFTYPLAIYNGMQEILREAQPKTDLVYLHNALYYYPLARSGLYRHTPMICTFHSGAAEYIYSNVERGKYGRLASIARLGGWMMGCLEHNTYRHMTQIMPRSHSVLHDLKQIYPDTPAPKADDVIPLCVDTDFYRPIQSAKARTLLGLPLDRKILMTARRLEGRMGLTHLVESMIKVCQQHPDALLLIAGKGFLRPTLEAMIAQYNLGENVRLLGYVSEAELPLHMAASDLFVLPTESLEGFGLATIESLACGTPVLGTPIGATPEILNPIHPRLLTTSITPDALAEGIDYWLNRPDELGSLRSTARAEAERKYSASQVAMQIESLFGRLAQERRP